MYSAFAASMTTLAKLIAIFLLMVAAATTASAKTLQFPNDQAVGDVYTHDRGQPVLSGEVRWRRNCQAKGGISLSDDAAVALRPYANTNLSILKCLGESDLDALWLEGRNLSDGDLRNLDHLHGLTELNLAGATLSVRGLPRLKRLRRLSLARASVKIDEDAARSLAALNTIRDLDLEGCNLDDRELEFLLDLPLQRLNLRGTNVSVVGLAALKEVPTLEKVLIATDSLRAARAINKLRLPFLDLAAKLSWSAPEFHAVMPKNLCGIESVSKLEAYGLWTETIVHLAPFRAPKMKSLSLEFNAIDDNIFPLVATFNDLEELCLASTDVSGEGASKMQALPHLRSLSLYHTPLTDTGLAAISKLSRLQALDLAFLQFDGMRVTAPGMMALTKLQSLKYLSLWDMPLECGAVIKGMLQLKGLHIPPGFIQFARDLPALEILNTDEHGSDDEHWSAEQFDDAIKISTLRSITVPYFSNAQFAKLSKLPNLRRISSRFSTLTDVGVEGLAAVGQLQEVRVGRLDISAIGIRNFAKMKALHRLEAVMDSSVEKELRNTMPWCRINASFEGDSFCDTPEPPCSWHFPNSDHPGGYERANQAR